MTQLSDSDWANLEQLERGGMTLDVRYAPRAQKLPAFMKLYAAGYATLQETGPGDSVHIFTITPAGATALAAHRGG